MNIYKTVAVLSVRSVRVVLVVAVVVFLLACSNFKPLHVL